MIIESTGRTVEEAINAALEELKLTREEVDFEILVEPKKGLFGLMNRKAKVLVTPKAESAKKVIGDTDEADSVVDEWKAKATALGEKAMESAEDALRKAGAKADEIDVKQTAFNNKVKAKLDTAIDSAKDAVNEQVDTASAVAAAVKNTLSERRSRKERNAEDAVKNFVVDEAVVEEAKSFLTKVFKAMNVEVVMEKFINKQDGCVILKLHGVDMGKMCIRDRSIRVLTYAALFNFKILIGIKLRNQLSVIYRNKSLYFVINKAYQLFSPVLIQLTHHIIQQ